MPPLAASYWSGVGGAGVGGNVLGAKSAPSCRSKPSWAAEAEAGRRADTTGMSSAIASRRARRADTDVCAQPSPAPQLQPALTHPGTPGRMHLEPGQQPDADTCPPTAAHAPRDVAVHVPCTGSTHVTKGSCTGPAALGPTLPNAALCSAVHTYAVSKSHIEAEAGWPRVWNRDVKEASALVMAIDVSLPGRQKTSLRAQSTPNRVHGQELSRRHALVLHPLGSGALKRRPKAAHIALPRQDRRTRVHQGHARARLGIQYGAQHARGHRGGHT
jgi:hypothetical protein